MGQEIVLNGGRWGVDYTPFPAHFQKIELPHSVELYHFTLYSSLPPSSVVRGKAIIFEEIGVA